MELICLFSYKRKLIKIIKKKKKYLLYLFVYLWYCLSENSLAAFFFENILLLQQKIIKLYLSFIKKEELLLYRCRHFFSKSFFLILFELLLKILFFLEQCGGRLLAMGQERVITSPGYMERGYYLNGQQCSWRIKSIDPKKKVTVRFTEDFGLYCFVNCYHWVEIKFKKNLGLTGPRY